MRKSYLTVLCTVFVIVGCAGTLMAENMFVDELKPLGSGYKATPMTACFLYGAILMQQGDYRINESADQSEIEDMRQRNVTYMHGVEFDAGKFTQELLQIDKEDISIKKGVIPLEVLQSADTDDDKVINNMEGSTFLMKTKYDIQNPPQE